ncbi:MAG: hypothetical protein HY075_16875 [Deltaproteobacteria bacterium]|nr:hypothetical protein [Deltaproteobacteria bacterium]
MSESNAADSNNGNEAEPGSPSQLAALFTIFEKHLYDFEEDTETEMAFIDKIVNDYLRYLASRKVAVPKKFLNQIVDELRHQVRTMMVKKMYGCLSIEEFMGRQTDRSALKKDTRKKYSKLW